MKETTFAADPMRLMIAAAVGIVVLLVLIIKFKLHPVLSMMISAIIIGAGAGMPLMMISDTVEKGVGKTLQGIALLVGLGDAPEPLPNGVNHVRPPGCCGIWSATCRSHTGTETRSQSV